MTSREREILMLIKRNPMVSQNELADQLNITRSSVSVHISNLMRKGFIKGKGYVVNESNNDVIVIGGSNVDITGNLTKVYYTQDSNPGAINMSLGGVGRNIAENLAHLGLHVQLVTALGDDVYGEEILKHCQSVGIDTALVKKYSDYRTSVYMQIMDHEGQLQIAVSDMDIVKHITPTMLDSYKHHFENAKAIIIEGNLEVDAIQYMAKHYGKKLFFDPVSIKKAEKIKGLSLLCITPNLEEAKKIAASDGSENEMLLKLRENIQIPMITLGEEGVAFMNNDFHIIPPKKTHVKNVTGAGDAFMAGVVYGFMKDLESQDMIKCGMVMSKYALESHLAVNPAIKEIDLVELKELI